MIGALIRFGPSVRAPVTRAPIEATRSDPAYSRPGDSPGGSFQLDLFRHGPAVNGDYGCDPILVKVVDVDGVLKILSSSGNKNESPIRLIGALNLSSGTEKCGTPLRSDKTPQAQQVCIVEEARIEAGPISRAGRRDRHQSLTTRCTTRPEPVREGELR